MLSSKLIRWSGVANLLSGVLFITLAITDLITYPSLPSWMPGLSLALFVIVQWGLLGLYARQVEKAGILALIGFLLTSVGFTFFGGLAFFETFMDLGPSFRAPDLPYQLTGVMFALGSLVFGVAIIRVASLFCWAALLFVVGGVVIGLSGLVGFGSAPPLVSPPQFAVLFGLSLIWLGYAVWSRS